MVVVVLLLLHPIEAAPWHPKTYSLLVLGTQAYLAKPLSHQALAGLVLLRLVDGGGGPLTA